MTTSTPPLDLTPFIERLEVVNAGDHRSIFLNGHLVARYSCDDKSTERILATQLAGVLSLPDRQIAAAFNWHPVTLSRLRGLARTGGAAALVPVKTGPKGPTKVTPKIEAKCRALREQGLSIRAIAGKVSRHGQRISYVTVAALLKRQPAEPNQAALVFEPAEVGDAIAAEGGPAIEIEPVAAPPAEETTAQAVEVAATEAPAQSGDPAGPEPREETGVKGATMDSAAGRFTRYAGAMMLYAALGRLGLWDVFQRLGASAGPSRQFGWTQTVASVIFCFALRFRSIEDWKNGWRSDLGVLIGEDLAPSVLTMRTKVKALVESVDPLAFSREMFGRYLAQEPVWEGLYYVDGHFSPYYGHHATPRGWDAKRGLAVKGHTDVYIHDARGRSLFFFSQPLNDSLARALPSAVAEIRRVHGAAPFTLVFDRGGYSGDAFRLLNAENIGFITYLKGRGARRRYPMKPFQRGWFSFEGKRHCYRLMEKKTRVGKVGLTRTIVFVGDDGQQIPVLTNLAQEAKAAKVVHCLRLRWRQENSFKYLTEHYGIDQIVQYGAEPEAAGRQVANPKRKAIQEQARTLAREVETLEAQLGRALENNDETKRPTARGVKIALSGLRGQIAQKKQALTRVENRLRHTPGQVTAEKAGMTRELLREDRRLLVNALKLAAYNCERTMALRFNRHYDCSKDVFSVFRCLLNSPGVVRPTSAGLQVHLNRPDSPKVAEALELFLSELNTEPTVMFGDGPPLTFRLSDLNQVPALLDKPL
jgi:hypothetical protein